MIQLTKTTEIVLGYHSPTEWVFFPEALALYDSIIINKDVFEEKLNDGYSSKSGYEETKAIILEELENAGRLKPIKYDINYNDRMKLKNLVDVFFEKYPNDIRILSANAYDAFYSHERKTLETLVSINDPYWKDVGSRIISLEKKANLLKDSSISFEQLKREIPELKAVITPYFEDSFFTSLISKSSYNPIFQWVGYAPFEEWILKLRDDKINATKRIKKGTDYRVLCAFTQIAIPARIPIKNKNEVHKILDKWDEFRQIRSFIDKQNRDIWSIIDEISNLEDDEIPEFVKYFENILETKTQRINNQIRQKDYEIEREKSFFSRKIDRIIIQTLGSFTPLSPIISGFSKLLDDIHDILINNEVKSYYPDLREMFEYENILNSLSYGNGTVPPFASVSGTYKSKSFWGGTI